MDDIDRKIEVAGLTRTISASTGADKEECFFLMQYVIDPCGERLYAGGNFRMRREALRLSKVAATAALRSGREAALNAGQVQAIVAAADTTDYRFGVPPITYGVVGFPLIKGGERRGAIAIVETGDWQPGTALLAARVAIVEAGYELPTLLCSAEAERYLGVY